MLPCSSLGIDRPGEVSSSRCSGMGEKGRGRLQINEINILETEGGGSAVGSLHSLGDTPGRKEN